VELFASACVLSRWDAALPAEGGGPQSGASAHTAAELFLRGSFRRARRSLAEMNDTDDAMVTAVADWALQGGGDP
jgi:hypothetical protein